MDDWKPGDLALCVNDSGWIAFDEGGTPRDMPGPGPGSVHEVTDVLFVEPLWCGHCNKTHEQGTMLRFAPWPGDEFGPARECFVKINPLTEDEEREARREIERDQRKPVLAPSRHDVGYTRALLGAVGALRARV